MSLISAVVLPSGARVTPEPVLLDTGDIHQIQDIIGGWFDAVRVVAGQGDDEAVLVGYVHDEGLVLDMEPNYLATDLFRQEIRGPVVVVSGTNPENGEYDGESYDLPSWVYEAITTSLVDHTANLYNRSQMVALAIESCVEELLCTPAERDSLIAKMELSAKSNDANVMSDADRKLLSVLEAWAEVELYRMDRLMEAAKGDSNLLGMLVDALADKDKDKDKDEDEDDSTDPE